MNVTRYRVVLISMIFLISTLIFTAGAKFTSNSEEQLIINTAPEFMYYLKETEEKIGIYKYNENDPFRILDVYTYTLPYADQYELESGILVKDDEKLNMIIEDYES